jgi:hypothetical protein
MLSAFQITPPSSMTLLLLLLLFVSCNIFLNLFDIGILSIINSKHLSTTRGSSHQQTLQQSDRNKQNVVYIVITEKSQHSRT